MNDKQREEMGSSDIGKLLLKLSIPCVLGLLLVSATSFLDAFYVSYGGGEADECTANQGIIGAFFPVVSFIQAIGYTLGIGGGCTVSRLLGQNDKKRARVAVSFSLMVSFLVGIVFAIIGVSFRNSIMRVLDVKVEWMDRAKWFAGCMFMSAPFSATVITMSSILRAKGKTVWALWGFALTGGVKLVLMPFILWLNVSVLNGIAISNLVGQVCGCAAMLVMLQKDKLGLQWRHALDCKMGSTILKMGIPSLFRQGTIVASSLLTSRLASSLGGNFLTTMSVVTRSMTALSSLPIGIGQGYQPIVGYNDGAGLYDRIRKAFKIASIWGTVIIIPTSLALIFLSEYFLTFFLNDTEMLGFALWAIRIQLLTLPLLQFITVVSMSYQAIGRKGCALLLAALRQGIVLIPVILCAVNLWRDTGLAVAQAVADAITFALCIPFGVRFYRIIKQKEEKKTV